ncbi:hypothetical protein LXT12_02360 [Pelomonas sp. P7]|uniref:4Fe-4S ferredoxin-type domain-containing protein n=1 Tax=Pelomonas caseinilytica TaxID=2906763 RepID=A0ABS8XB40_9BURK|nr:hypothetical protein [Pelomonas sp. P7]
MTPRRVIHIHPEAPPKPAPGQPCNGCGVCCLAEPCPLGVVLSRRLRGACVALRWDGARYLCGALTAQPSGLFGRWGLRLVRRWIAAGAGCDCSLEPAGKP